MSSTTATLGAAALEGLQVRFRGELIQPNDPGYEAARRVYNASIDRRPRLIARCADVADVMAAVEVARSNQLPLAVRGGGHNVAGLGTCDGGIVLDLSRMRGVRVDPERRVARVEGGATLGDLDHATHAFGLAVPAGVVSTTGVGGLTLGGGLGHLNRAYGLTCDNLLSADVVTADGRLVTASEDEHGDLFWALRGGGGNFGVVTSFEFRLHPVATVLAGPVLYPVERARDVLRFYREFIPAAPEALNAIFAFLIAPSAPFIPEPLQGRTFAGIVACYAGPVEAGQEVVRPLREFGPPALDLMAPLPYPALQGLFDALLPPGLHHYWKADFVHELSDEMIEIHATHGPRVGSVQSGMFIYPTDGAVQRVAPEATAYSYRDANFIHIIAGTDPDPAAMPGHIEWVRAYWDALHPLSAGGTYVNFLGDEGQERVRATYRDNLPRLRAVKTAYDPENLFRLNQNIPPA